MNRIRSAVPYRSSKVLPTTWSRVVSNQRAYSSLQYTTCNSRLTTATVAPVSRVMTSSTTPSGNPRANELAMDEERGSGVMEGPECPDRRRRRSRP